MSVGQQNEATRIAWLEKTLAAVPANGRILDAGAGELQFKRLCTHLDYVAQDFGQYDGTGDGAALQMGSWDQTKLDITCDITDIPEPDQSFDAIMCTEVLEHLPNPVLAIQEFSRLLRKDGQLILTAPFCSMTHFAPYHFSTGFNSYFYLTHLEANGFEIIKLERNGNYFKFLAQTLGQVWEFADQYANDRPRKFERYALKIIMRMLERFSSKDSGSQELLCFGYHVLARKR